MDRMHLGTWVDELTVAELPALERTDTLGDALAHLNRNVVTRTVEMT
jgi:hypothetical protein